VTAPAFAGWYQIIATNFTISIPGAVTESGDLDVNLLPSGRARFLDSSGVKTAEYSHEPTQQDFKYAIATGAAIGGGSLGGDANNPDLIGVSPCTRWTVEVVASFNPGLDLSKVAEIDVTFSGLYFPLQADELRRR
jgi:hypothetical protein